MTVALSMVEVAGGLATGSLALPVDAGWVWHARPWSGRLPRLGTPPSERFGIVLATLVREDAVGLARRDTVRGRFLALPE